MSTRWRFGAIAYASLGLVSCSGSTNQLADATDAPAIDAPAGPVITSFTAEPSLLPAGEVIPLPITLTWAVEGSASLSISGIGAVTGTSAIGSATGSASFELTATGSNGAISTATATVGVDTDGTLGIYVDPVNGDDRHPGQPDSPVKSIDRAAALVPTGENIFLAAGDYTPPTSFSGAGGVTIPSGVSIAPLANGVTFTGAPSNVAIVFAGSGAIANVQMASFGEGVVATAGHVAISGVQFTGCGEQDSGQAAIDAGGSANVTVTPGGLASYVVAPTNNFAIARGSAHLEIDGGAISGVGPSQFSGVWAIDAQGSAQLVLDGVTMDGNTVNALQLEGSATATIKHGSVIHNSAGTGASAATIVMQQNPTLVLDASTISASPAVAILATNAQAGGQPTITLQNGAIVETAQQIGISTAAAAVSVLGSHVTGNLGAGIQMTSGSLTTSAGSTISANAAGVKLTSNGVFAVTIRGTQVENNTGVGLTLDVAPTSTIDLGTAATAGANTFSGNTGENLDIEVALAAANLVITALGNTFDASVQGADANGSYATATTLSAPPTVTGQNVRLVQTGTPTSLLQLVLAQ